VNPCPQWGGTLDVYGSLIDTVVTETAALSGELIYGNEWTIREAETHDHLLVWLALNPLYEPAAFPTLRSVADISDAEKQQIAHGNAERYILKPRGLE